MPTTASERLAETRTFLASQRTLLACAHVAIIVAGIAIMRRKRSLFAVTFALLLLGIAQDHVVRSGPDRVPRGVVHAVSWSLFAASVGAAAWMWREEE